MIKNIKIENFKGIKKLELDFTLTHVRGNGGLARQMISKEGTHVALTPTFLAKNAAGKSSLIDALAFVSKFIHADSLARFISQYVWRYVADIERKIRNNENSFEDDNIQIESYIDEQEFQSNVLNDILTKYSNAQENKFYIEINNIDGTSASIECSEESFILKKNNTLIDISSIISNALNDYMRGYGRQHRLRGHLNSFRSAIVAIEMYKSYHDVKADLLDEHTFHLIKYEFKDVDSEMLNSRRNSSEFDKQIYMLKDNFGIDFVNNILSSIDPNIKAIKFDVQKKIFNFYTGEGDFPITSSNLSYGTKKVISIIHAAIPILQWGGCLMIDEIENGLHLSLIELIVSIFKNKHINRGQAQLISTTHNPLLFEREIIEHKNVFIGDIDSEGKFNFIKISDIDLGEKQRTEAIYQLVKAKNYFNDIFWFKLNLPNKSTLNEANIDSIISDMENHVLTFRGGNG